jgi:hypothetical protein
MHCFGDDDDKLAAMHRDGTLLNPVIQFAGIFARPDKLNQQLSLALYLP